MMKIIHIKPSFRSILLITFTLVFILAGCYLSQLFSEGIIKMNQQNYTTLLKDIHNNVADYSGEKIKLSGYIYRLPDFQENQFVIARNMMVTETDYRVVGFLCEYHGTASLQTDTWVKAEGMITLSDYHGPMPVIHITKIQNSKMPEDITVLPPQ